MGDKDTHYQTLGIPEDASAEDVRRAYKARLLVVHPDKTGHSSSERDGEHASESGPASASLLARIKEAYAVLKDPDDRDMYDEWLRDRRMYEEAIDTYDTVLVSDLEVSPDGAFLTFPCRCGDEYVIDADFCHLSNQDHRHDHDGAGPQDGNDVHEDSGKSKASGEGTVRERLEFILECPSCSLRLLVRGENPSED